MLLHIFARRIFDWNRVGKFLKCFIKIFKSCKATFLRVLLISFFPLSLSVFIEGGRTLIGNSDFLHLFIFLSEWPAAIAIGKYGYYFGCYRCTSRYSQTQSAPAGQLPICCTVISKNIEVIFLSNLNRPATIITISTYHLIIKMETVTW